MSEAKGATGSTQATPPCAKMKRLDAAFATADAALPPRKRDREVVVGRADEIPLGGKKIVQIGRLSIGVYHLESGFHGILNYCPHQGAELCKGTVHGTYRPSEVNEFEPALAGRVLRCPWHGWEFDIVTGKGLYDDRGRVSTYEVRVNDAGDLVVWV
ncbi:MAG: Rieske 2Fe-2S domain-containing protein [Rariglobus sp.]